MHDVQLGWLVLSAIVTGPTCNFISNLVVAAFSVVHSAKRCIWVYHSKALMQHVDRGLRALPAKHRCDCNSDNISIDVAVLISCLSRYDNVCNLGGSYFLRL
jgi:hypothetical protein